MTSGEASLGVGGDQFQFLRHRLDKLGYKDHFSPDSIHLVLKLLNDLIQTTESCKRLKVQNDKFTQDRKRTDLESEPLRQTIAQLTKENNLLHVHMISAADARDEREKKSNLALRKYQNELNDLKFINKQLLTRLEKETRKSDGERARIGNVLDMLGCSLGHEVDSKLLKVIPPSKLVNFVPRVDIETGLEPMSNIMSHPPPLLFSADMLKISEEKCKKVASDLENCDRKVSILNEEISTLQEQVKTRDDEISRLGSLLEVERGHSTFPLEKNGPDEMHAFSSANRVSHLENQLEYLSETVSSLEKVSAVTVKNEKLEKEKAVLHSESQEKLGVLTAELQEMYQKNENLCNDLKHLENMVSELNGMKRGTLKHGSKHTDKRPALKPSRVDEIYEKLKKTSAELDSNKSKMEKLAAELKNTRDAKSKLDVDLQHAKEEILSLTRKLLEEKNSASNDLPQEIQWKLDDLSKELSKKNQRVKELEMALDNIKTSTEQDKNHELVINSFKTQIIEKTKEIDELKQSLKDTKDQMKEKDNDHQKLLLLYREANEKASDINMAKNIPSMDSFNPRSKEIQPSISSGNLSQTYLTTSEKLGDEDENSKNRLNEDIKITVSERTTAEWEQIVEELKSQNQTLIDDLTRLSNIVSSYEEAEKKRRLTNVNSDMNIHYQDLIKNFDQERDRLHNEIDSKTEEIAALKMEMLSLKKIFEKKSSLDDELINLQQVTENKQREVLSLQNQLNEARKAVDQIANDYEALQERHGNLQADFSGIIHENQSLKQQLSDSTSELQKLRQNEDNQHQQLEYFQQIVQAKDDERDHIMASYRRLVQEHSENQKHVQTLVDDIQKLTYTLTTSDERIKGLLSDIEMKNIKEKEMLKDLQEYESKITDLENEIHSIKNSVHGRDSAISNMQNELSMMRELLVKSQRHGDELQNQLFSANAERNRLQAQFDILGKENEDLINELKDERDKCTRFETLLNEERNKAIHTELSRRDLMNEKRSVEQQLSEIHHVQHTKHQSVSRLAADVKRLECDNQNLKERVEALQNALLEQVEQLRIADDDRIRLQLKLDNVIYSAPIPPPPPLDSYQQTPAIRTNLQNQVNGDKDFTNNYTISSPTLLEQKIMKELSSTKKQLKKYEYLINERIEGRNASSNETKKESPDPKTIPISRTAKVSNSPSENITRDLMKTWKAQNEELKRELESYKTENIDVGQRLMRTSTTGMEAQNAEEPLDISHLVDPFAKSLDESERKRKQLEEENRQLLSVVKQVRNDLKLAQSPPPS